MTIQTILQIAKENGALIYLTLLMIGLLWMWNRKCKEVKELKEELEWEQKIFNTAEGRSKI